MCCEAALGRHSHSLTIFAMAEESWSAAEDSLLIVNSGVVHSARQSLPNGLDYGEASTAAPFPSPNAYSLLSVHMVKETRAFNLGLNSRLSPLVHRRGVGGGSVGYTITSSSLALLAFIPLNDMLA